VRQAGQRGHVRDVRFHPPGHYFGRTDKTLWFVWRPSCPESGLPDLGIGRVGIRSEVGGQLDGGAVTNVTLVPSQSAVYLVWEVRP
jgi:hypothetical protein